MRDDDREIVKVLDFGIAKSTAVTPDGQTRTGAVLGTPYYMSPEQAKGTKEVDHRTDLWALGVIAFECLTGALPFVSEAFGDLVLKIVVEPLPVPSQLAPVPAGFDAWWAKAVARDPAGRFQSAKEMVDALATALGVRAPEGIGASTPSGLAGTGLAGSPAGTSRPPSPIPARSARATPGTLGPGATATATVSPLPGRDRARVLGALALIGIVVAGAVAALRSPAPPASGAGPQVRAASALVSVEVPAVAQAAPSVAPTAIPTATPTASASAAPAPSASAASSAASTADPAPTTAPLTQALHGPGVTTSKPAAGKPAVAPAKGSGHDIGF